MNCHEFDQRIQQLLDARMSPASDAQLQGHALRCAACEDLLAGYTTLLSGVQQSVATGPKVGNRFAAQVVSQVQAEESVALAVSDGPSRWRVWGTLATVAALVLLAVGVGTWSNLGQAGRNQGGAVAKNERSRPPAGVVGIATRGPLEQTTKSVAPPQIAAVPRTQQHPALGTPAASRPDDFYGYRISIQTLAMQLPSAVGQIDTVEQYAPSIRPIRESFSTAFETLWRTLPGKPVEQSDQRPQAGTIYADSAMLA